MNSHDLLVKNEVNLLSALSSCKVSCEFKKLDILFSDDEINVGVQTQPQLEIESSMVRLQHTEHDSYRTQLSSVTNEIVDNSAGAAQLDLLALMDEAG